MTLPPPSRVPGNADDEDFPGVDTPGKSVRPEATEWSRGFLENLADAARDRIGEAFLALESSGVVS